MKLLICGDRNWVDSSTIRWWLSELKPDLVIEGGANGADKLAGAIARSKGIHVAEVTALWYTYYRSAGYRRNAIMLQLKPDLVLAFHSNIADSEGTGMMLDLAEQSGIDYALVEGEPCAD